MCLCRIAQCDSPGSRVRAAPVAPVLSASAVEDTSGEVGLRSRVWLHPRPQRSLLVEFLSATAHEVLWERRQWPQCFLTLVRVTRGLAQRWYRVEVTSAAPPQPSELFACTQVQRRQRAVVIILLWPGQFQSVSKLPSTYHKRRYQIGFGSWWGEMMNSC